MDDIRASHNWNQNIVISLWCITLMYYKVMFSNQFGLN